MKSLAVRQQGRGGLGSLTDTSSRLPSSAGRKSGCLLLIVVMCTMPLFISACRSKERLPEVGSKTYADFVSAFYIGLAGLQVGDDVRADAKLQQATELVPAEPAGWIDWGVLALRQRNFDPAAQRLERAHTLAPN